MQYVMMFLESADGFDQREDPQRADGYWGAWSAYVDELERSGITTAGAGLQPPATATTVRMRDGRRVVHDGPFADSKEQLGGFFVIDVPDLDTALAWAERCPSASYASVEIRPVLPPPAA